MYYPAQKSTISSPTLQTLDHNSEINYSVHDIELGGVADIMRSDCNREESEMDGAGKGKES